MKKVRFSTTMIRMKKYLKQQTDTIMDQVDSQTIPSCNQCQRISIAQRVYDGNRSGRTRALPLSRALVLRKLPQEYHSAHRLNTPGRRPCTVGQAMAAPGTSCRYCSAAQSSHLVDEGYSGVPAPLVPRDREDLRAEHEPTRRRDGRAVCVAGGASRLGLSSFDAPRAYRYYVVPITGKTRQHR